MAVQPLVAAIENGQVLLVHAPVAQGIPDTALGHGVGIAAGTHGRDDHVVAGINVEFLQQGVHGGAVRHHAHGYDHAVAPSLDPLARRRGIGEHIGAVGFDVFGTRRTRRDLKDDELAGNARRPLVGPITHPALERRGGDQAIDVVVVVVRRHLGDRCRRVHRNLGRQRAGVLTSATATLQPGRHGERGQAGPSQVYSLVHRHSSIQFHIRVPVAAVPAGQHPCYA